MKLRHTGLTIMEILVAVAIIAILAAGLYSVSNHFEKQAKVNITQSTIETLVTAIEQYRDFKGSFFKAGTDYGRSQLQANDVNGLNCTITNLADYNDMYASSEALYYKLNQIPASRKIIDSVKDVASVKNVLITNKDYKGTEYFINFTGDPVNYPLLHILDAWGTPLRYTYGTGDNFPVITSAGPDKDFNKTADNLSSR